MKHTTAHHFRQASLLCILLIVAFGANAELEHTGVLNEVFSEFKTSASSWSTLFIDIATRLFWTLVTISMVWTFGMMAMRKADLGDFFAEFVRFTCTTGFFWWLVETGPAKAISIIDSLIEVASGASGTGSMAETLTGSSVTTPSDLIDIGFILLGGIITESSVFELGEAIVGVTLGLGILFMFTLIAVNYVLLLISGWILVYAGAIYLGFGGSRWTSDIAISYFKAVAGLAVQIMVMLLLVGIGKDMIDRQMTRMSDGTNFNEMAVIFVSVFILFHLVNRVPGMVAGIISGASVSSGIGQFGGGAAMAAAGTAVAAGTMAARMTGSTLTQAAGGASAVMAAYQQASANLSRGGDSTTTGTTGLSGGGDSSAGPNYASSAGLGDSGASKAPSNGSVGGTQGKGGIGGALKKGGQLVAETGAVLAKGMAEQAKNKVSEAIAGTAGGRLADIIRQQGKDHEKPGDNNQFTGNNISGANDSQTAEIAAFVNGKGANHA